MADTAAMAPPPRTRSFDVLRGVAVLLVMAHHLPGPDTTNWLRGGWLGVDLFFVLSGFWITRQLLPHLHPGEARPRAVALAFWRRRARRLLPALGTFLVAWTVVVATAGELSSLLRGNIAASALWAPVVAVLAGLTNLAYGVVPIPVSFAHLWSLAVEWQFYALAPFLLLAVLTAGTRRRMLAVLAGLAVIVGVLAAVQADNAAQGYLSTLGRAPALLGGVLVALAVSPSVAGRPIVVPRRVQVPLLVGAGVVMAVLVVLADKTSLLWLLTAIPVMAVCSTVVTWSFASMPGVPGPQMVQRFLGWAGRRSYGAYLWNWPLTLVLASLWPSRDGFLATTLLAVTVFAATAAAAELSWRLVEDPWLRHPKRGQVGG